MKMIVRNLVKSRKQACPYMIRLCFRSKDDAFFLANPNLEKESYHNHSLAENNLLYTASGRRSALIQNEATLANDIIVSMAPARNIQRAITGDDGLLHKLTVNDINNLHYESADGVSDKRPFKSANKLIQLMEDS
ncbi:unnamed protein product [Rhizopus microsporus]